MRSPQWRLAVSPKTVSGIRTSICRDSSLDSVGSCRIQSSWLHPKSAFCIVRYLDKRLVGFFHTSRGSQTLGTWIRASTSDDFSMHFRTFIAGDQKLWINVWIKISLTKAFKRLKRFLSGTEWLAERLLVHNFREMPFSNSRIDRRPFSLIVRFTSFVEKEIIEN